MNLVRENDAINAYLKFLETKGAAGAVLHKRTLFLELLKPRLANCGLNGSEYHEAVDALMETMPAVDWHTGLTTAREFYLFWIQNIKAITAFNINPGFDIELTPWLPSATSLNALVSNLADEQFDVSENWSLKSYAHALRNEGCEQALVETRVNLAKILLIRLKAAPLKNHKTYRTVVDQTLPLFQVRQSRLLFLLVMREFYYFWTGNPQASTKVLKGGTVSMLT